MKLWTLTPKETPNYDCWLKFVVVAETLPDALEATYAYVRDEESDSFPYYLRSSNLRIERLGEFAPNEEKAEKIRRNPVLSAERLNA